MRHRLLLLGMLLAVSADAIPARWQSKAASDALEFTVRFEGTEVPGVFRRFDVALETSPAGPEGGKLEVLIDVSSADLSSADINEAIADPEWFDFPRYPSARFESSDIVALGDGQHRARGRLRLKGVERSVDFTFEWTRAEATASMRGGLRLRRGDFDIGSGAWAADDAIGQDVDIRFDVTLETVD